MTDLVTRVRDFALKAHGDQKYGDAPYVTHLDDVAEVLREFGFTDDHVQVVAYLHDVLEDTDANLVLATEPGDLPLFDLHYAVQFCTDEPGPNRRERKRATYARMVRAVYRYERETLFPKETRAGILVKLADRIANIRRSKGSDLFKMYKREEETFRLACHTPGLCDPMWDEYHKLLRGHE